MQSRCPLTKKPARVRKSAEERRAENKRKHAEATAKRDEAMRATRPERKAAKRAEKHERSKAEFPFLDAPFEEKITEVTESIFEEIILRVSDGEIYSRVCYAMGLRKWRARNWLIWHGDEPSIKGDSTSATWSTRWHDARKAQAESWADELVEIADGTTPEESAVARLRVDTRKWVMGKNSARFADKSTLALEGGDPDKPIRTKVVDGMTDEEAAEAYAQTLSETKKG